MKRFRDIIESAFPVPTNALWLNGTNIKGFINGKWVTLGSNERISWNDIEDKPQLATVATSGSYSDLKNTPSVVSSSVDGLMSTSLYKKLNNIEEGANNYVLPVAGTSIGGVKKAAAVADLAGTEDASAICTKVNELLSSLRSAGVLGV